MTVVSVCEFRPNRADCFFVEFFAEVLWRWFMWFPKRKVLLWTKRHLVPLLDQIKEFFFYFLSPSAASTVRRAVRQVVHVPPAHKSSADRRMKVKALGYIDRPPSGCHGDANKSSTPPPTSARLV